MTRPKLTTLGKGLMVVVLVGLALPAFIQNVYWVLLQLLTTKPGLMVTQVLIALLALVVVHAVYRKVFTKGKNNAQP